MSADAGVANLKTADGQPSCGFESRRPHQTMPVQSIDIAPRGDSCSPASFGAQMAKCDIVC